MKKKKDKIKPGEIVFMEKDSGTTLQEIGEIDFAEKAIYVILALLLWSCIFSVLHLFATYDSVTCKTNGRYIPTTFLFCKLSEPVE